MNIVESQFSRKAALNEDLAQALQVLQFRAGDGASCCGRLVTLHAYSATSFGEKAFLDVVVERAVAPQAGTPRFLPKLALALELSNNAGDAPLPPVERVYARNALFQIINDPNASEESKGQAVAALYQMNLPRLSQQITKQLRFLVGVRHNLTQELHTVALDGSGFAFIPDVPSDAHCWVRVRHGPILALEIAEFLRSRSVVPGNDLHVSSETGDWRLQFGPLATRARTSGLEVSLGADPELAFPPSRFAIVAAAEESGADWHVALLDRHGKGALKGLAPVPHRVSIALAPHASAASGLEPNFSAVADVREEPGKVRLTVEAHDPVLAKSRCVCLWRGRAGRAIFVGEVSLPDATIEGEWRGKTETKVNLPTAVALSRGRRVVTGGGMVLASGPPKAGRPAGSREFACFVLL